MGGILAIWTEPTVNPIDVHLISRKRPAKDSIGCSRAMAPVCEMVSVILRSFQGLLETGREVVLAFLNRSVM